MTAPVRPADTAPPATGAAATGTAADSPAPPMARTRTTGRAVGRAPGRLGLRSRLTVLTALAVGVAVALSALSSYLVLHRQLYRELDAALLISARTTARAANAETSYLLAAATSGTMNFELARITPDGAGRAAVDPAAASSDGLVSSTELAVAAGRRATTLRSAHIGDTDYRVAAVAIPGQPRSALVFGRSLSDTQQTLRTFALVLGAIGLGGVLLAGMAGYSVARTGLRPVAQLTTAAEQIARTTRLTPLVVPTVRRNDDVTRLARAFNRMLAAIAESLDRERRLIADAGHELRTPLTSMRTNLDLLLQADRLAAGTHGSGEIPVLAPADRAEMLSDLRAQTEELSGLVNDLVQLARDDQARAVDIDVDLAEVVEMAVDRVRRRAPGLTFRSELAAWQVRGNPALLERAVVNVLDNAAKWSPPGATVTVELASGVVRISDAGPGITATDLPRVFDRFFRADTARTTAGTGLGLAIVRQVVESHGGTVRAEPAPGGGARFCLVFPPAS